MIRSFKGYGFIILFIILLTFSSSIVLADSSTKQRIYDFANLLTLEEVERLETMAQKYSTRRDTDFIILTTNDTKGKDIVEYMEDFYDDKALGYDKPHGNTAILTIDMNNRDVYLAGFYKGEEYLDDYRLDLIQDKITPDLSNGDFYKAFRKFIKTSYKYMGIRPGVDPDNILFKLGFQITTSLIVAGIVVGSMAYNTGGRVTVYDGTYRDFSNSRILNRRDIYLRTSVTKHKKPSNNNRSGGSGGSGISRGGGMTRGGHSHSGSRGKF